MKVLLVHNHYQQPGGEDEVFRTEAELLEDNGHQVIRYTQHNDQIRTLSKIDVARKSVWNRRVERELRELGRNERPDIAHFHNTFPLISPAAYYAIRGESIPVVQTLHNYRLLCLNALLFRTGRPCEDCVGKTVPWPGILHACYRGSRFTTAAVATTHTIHRLLRTWNRQVDVFVALAPFARRKFLAGGIPRKKVLVKPNVLHPDPGVGDGSGGFAVFVGRLSEEKGVRTLLETWSDRDLQIPLHIIGDGPLAEQVSSAANSQPTITSFGQIASSEVLAHIRKARCLVLPSVCYENSPRVVAEAFAVGTPVISGRLGATGEMVEHGRTGLLFHTGNAVDLRDKLREIFRQSTAYEDMRLNARAEYEKLYSANANYKLLLNIYETAITNFEFRQSKIAK